MKSIYLDALRSRRRPARPIAGAWRQIGQVPAAAESAMATAMAATTLGKLLRAALTSRIVLAGFTVTTNRPRC
jgi:hypothetical protein